jgi:glutathione peroxidase
MTGGIYELTATRIDGQPQALSDYRGQVLLIVNVASKCGFTGQYAGLEALYQTYRARQFSILGFPCDQFGHQEPDDNAAIQSFCSRTYQVTFPLFAKIEVNGPNAHPLYNWLKASRSGLLGTRWIKWNFTKFLVERTGNVAGRYGPLTPPARLTQAVERLL